MEELEGQLNIFGLNMPCGKMSPEHSQATAARTSKPSSRNSSASQSQQRLMCLCLKRVDGAKPDACKMIWADGASHGELWTLNTGERPSEENASRLSQILEERAHPKYSLSARACKGILNRASRRGKELPEELKSALLQQCSSGGCVESND